MALNKALLEAVNQQNYILACTLLPKKVESSDLHIITDQHRKLLHQACYDGQLIFIQQFTEIFQVRPGYYDIWYAILGGHLSIVKYLVVVSGCRPATQHLDVAIQYGYFDIVKCLVSDGGCKPTLMHLNTAIQRKDLNIVKCLVADRACKPTIEHLESAIQSEHLDIVKCLVIKGGCKSTTRHLDIAIQRKNYDIVKCLVVDGACKPTTGNLDAAIQSRIYNIVICLIVDGGCKPTTEHLDIAIQRKNFDIVKWLVADGGCKPSARHLNTAIGRELFDIVKFLVFEGGCKLTTKHLDTAIQRMNFGLMKCLVDDCGCKPTIDHFDTAIHSGVFDTVKWLVADGGCKPSARQINTAIQRKNFDIVKWLVVDCGCKPTTEHLDTAIHSGVFDTVKWLVADGGCKPSARHLNTAIQRKNFFLVKWLVFEGGCKLTAEHLYATIQSGLFDYVKWLVIEVGCKPTKEHLDTAIENGYFEIVKCLVESGCRPTTKQLYTAIKNNAVEIAKFLIPSDNIDLNSRVGPNQGNVLHVACGNGQLDIVEHLIRDGRCDIREKDRHGNTALHIACSCVHYHIVKALLDTGKCDVNGRNMDGNAPLDLANYPQIIRDLIKYGANSTNMYKRFGSILGSSPKQPIEAPVKVFVTGDPSGGKSTLTKSLQKEASAFARVFSRPKKVSDVDEKTVGIIPYEHESRQYGSVIFYDLAGQREFYSSHAAVLSNTICSSPPIFLLVIDLQRSEEELKQSILYWLSFLENQCSSVNGKPHVIVIGSHADILKSRGEDPKHNDYIVKATLHHLSSTWFEFSGFISMDCRYPQSSKIERLRHQLDVSCSALRVTSTIQFNCHCLLVYLVDNFSKCHPVTLQELKDKMLCANNENSPINFVPLNVEVMLSMCEQLYDRGHILFLKNEAKVGDSWIIIDKEPLLSEVTGTMFAPEGFKQHCKLASSTGVVPLSEIVRHFPNHNPDMLICFFSHLEYCREICDQETLKQIEEHQSLSNSHRVGEEKSSGDQSFNPPVDRYFLFSGLITINRPDQVWDTNSQFSFKCGWMLQCSQAAQFYSSRFLQVLLLRIAFAFALSPHKHELDPSVPALQRKCSIWRNGIFWGDRYGLEALVEVIEYKTVIVLMQSQHLTGKCLQLRTSVINKVLKTTTDLCPKILTTESFINPSDLKSLDYPIAINSVLEQACSISEVATSICSAGTAVVTSTGKPVPLESLLNFEPYTKLSLPILQKLFDENIEQEEVTDKFLKEFAHTFCEIDPNEDSQCNLSLLQKCLHIPKDELMHGVEQEPRDYVKIPVHRCFLLLQTWKDQTVHPTLQALRRVLDQHSVFGGRNPMELGSVGFSYYLHSDTIHGGGGGGQETEEEVEPKAKEEKLMEEEAKEEVTKKHREVVHYKSDSNSRSYSSATNDHIHPCSVQLDTSNKLFVLDDLVFLMESLCQAAPQWYYIGLNLGVHPTKLDNISHNISLLPDSPKSYLREMLKTWLCLASPQAGSLPVLLSALKSGTVRENRLAKSVERQSVKYLEWNEEDAQKKLQEREVEEAEVMVEERVKRKMKVEEENEEREEVEAEEEEEEEKEEERAEMIENEEEKNKVVFKVEVGGTEVEYEEEEEKLNQEASEGEDKGEKGRTSRRKEKRRGGSYFNNVPESSPRAQIVGLRARALYDYQAACEDDISFDVDDTIESIERVFEEWWMGEVNGERGLFPANHVELI